MTAQYSLAELQAMTTEQLTYAFPQSNKYWQDQGYGLNVSALIRAIILATKGLHWPMTENRGCREVWYNPIKPILFKACQQRVDENNYMQVFEKILAQMVKNHELAYADLGISDFRTMRELYEAVDHAKCWQNILLFVEKDSAYVHLRPLRNLFNITLMSGGGWSHAAGIEAMLRDIKAKGISEVVVFTLTDYDPFGFAISAEFVSKCETLGLTVTGHHRIGISVEHATAEILEVQKYPIKKGRKLSVDEISFDADRWLAEYGIDRKYGLEIEAVSAQQGGHQYLREIVAAELLKYLNETERIEEIVKIVWQDAPIEAVNRFLCQIDHVEETWLSRESIDKKPERLPSKYINYQEFCCQYHPIKTEMEQQTKEIDAEISDLEDQLHDLRSEKSDIEQPYREKLTRLSYEYWRSRDVLAYCLLKYYEDNQAKWPRENYTLGYPPGCLLQAVKEQKNLESFIRQVDDKPLVNDLQGAFQESLDNWAIKDLISEVLKTGGSNL